MTESIKAKHDAFNLKFKEHEVFKDKLVVVDETDTPYLWLDRESGKVSFGFKYFHLYKEQRLIEALKRFVYIADEFVNGEDDESVDYVKRFKDAISFVAEIEHEFNKSQVEGFFEDYDGEEVLSDIRNFKDETDFKQQASKYVEATRGYKCDLSDVTKTKIIFSGEEWMYELTAEDEEFSGKQIEVYHSEIIYPE